MPHAEKWIDGVLWLQETPNGKWHQASDRDTIAALQERIVALEETLKKGLDDVCP